MGANPDPYWIFAANVEFATRESSLVVLNLLRSAAIPSKHDPNALTLQLVVSSGILVQNLRIHLLSYGELFESVSSHFVQEPSPIQSRLRYVALVDIGDLVKIELPPVGIGKFDIEVIEPVLEAKLRQWFGIRKFVGRLLSGRLYRVCHLRNQCLEPSELCGGNLLESFFLELVVNGHQRQPGWTRRSR